MLYHLSEIANRKFLLHKELEFFALLGDKVMIEALTKYWELLNRNQEILDYQNSKFESLKN